ncbi:hypothetical protein [Alloactinosynnema sp. L-07]|nr:hypothetical protein [Alloactinosynnema sp. L-07]
MTPHGHGKIVRSSRERAILLDRQHRVPPLTRTCDQRSPPPNASTTAGPAWFTWTQACAIGSMNYEIRDINAGTLLGSMIQRCPAYQAFAPSGAKLEI